MSRNRLLAVSFAYPPMKAAMSVLVWRLLRYSGHEFSVIRGFDGREADPGLAGIAEEGASGIFTVGFVEPRLSLLVRRVIYGTPLEQLVWIPDIYRRWVLPTSARVVSMCDPCRDVLVTFASPMSAHLVGLEARRRIPGLKWAAYFGDPWTNNPMIRRIRPAASLHRRLEKQVLNSADLLVFPCSEMRDFTLAGHGRFLLEKSRVAPHGFESRFYAGRPAGKNRGPLVIRHLGSLYGSRTPSDLADALELLCRERREVLENLRFEFFGTVQKGSRLGSPPESLISFHPSVPYLASLDLMSSADALLVITPSDPGSGVFLPSKLVDYIGAGRPIMGICLPGACRNVLESLGGWISERGSPASVAAALISLSEFLRSRGGDPLPWGEPSVRESFSAERTGRAFGAIMEELF